MLLALSVISQNSAALGATSYKVFDARGGTIGRVEGNDWVLPDPQKLVSSRHAIVRCMQGTFCLEDVSTNGTGLNSPQAVIPRGQLQPLNDGDRLYIGDFEVLVQVLAEASAPPPEPEPLAPALSATAQLEVLRPPPGALEDLLLDPSPAAAPVVSLPPPAPVYYAPAATAAPMPAAPPAAPMPSAVPSTPGALPDNWDLTGFLPQQPGTPPPAPAAYAAPPGYAPAPPAPPAYAPPPGYAAPAPAPAAYAPPPGYAPTAPPAAFAPPPSMLPPTGRPAALPAADVAALLASLGLQPQQVPPETLAQLGEILRVVVHGLMEVLQARKQVKDHFRMAMTIIRPVENNPLKFAATPEDAIYTLFVKRNPGYLAPIEAFREAFDDLSFHQLATLAGMRAAFFATLTRFNPDQLEAHWQKASGKKGGGIFGGGKTAFWDNYRHHFSQVAGDSEANFQQIFGEAFVRAYDDQIRKLQAAASRRS